MFKLKHVFASSIFMAAMATHGLVSAAEWRVNKAVFFDDPAVSYDSEEVLDVTQGTFFDGQFQSGAGRPVQPRNIVVAGYFAPDRAQGQTLSFSYSYEILMPQSRVVAGQGQAPKVDLPNMRADLSALFLELINRKDAGISWYPEVPVGAYYSAIGWNIGAPGWVPLTAHSDGSYSAQWMTPWPTNDFSGRCAARHEARGRAFASKAFAVN